MKYQEWLIQTSFTVNRIREITLQIALIISIFTKRDLISSLVLNPFLSALSKQHTFHR